MFTKFLSIEEEKRERVINAALKEFAVKGYAAASTNEIAKEAGISKGLVFHYFKSKKDLYFFLYDHTLEVVNGELRETVDLLETDLFVRMQQVIRLEMSVFGKYPSMMDYMKSVYLEQAEEVREDILERIQSLSASEYGKIFSGIDATKFKDGVSTERAINVILWTVEGLGEQYKERSKLTGGALDLDGIIDEFDEYMEMFKTTFYK
ncbi:TetR/AcrR family transcriptional regulator [Paenibacillus sp. 1011MAR3C5]|uniref:TetR/AcrR family transcriptional regulator n=1 Tax=Paenibacillus sp. 1011MAR3C5 TaxID=1675787 RepID=UPI001601D4F0|nr:TetR/AcrR family transcriptional regulator [Paenibacillus sp. 1011MAR3C5]